MSERKKIVIDAGHGGYDPGALGPNGLKEKDVALNVALLLAKELEADFDLVLTRGSDFFVELGQRATRSNDCGADAFLSIHCNSGDAGSGDGFEVFTAPGQTASDAFATDLFRAYGAEFPEKRKRMDLSDGDPDKEAKFTVLTRTSARAALFELEFIHTPAGERWLASAGNQARCAKALATGVRAHFGVASTSNLPLPNPKEAILRKIDELAQLAKAL